jgi:nucleotide-binding universal stress UspA family protein
MDAGKRPLDVAEGRPDDHRLATVRPADRDDELAMPDPTSLSEIVVGFGGSADSNLAVTWAAREAIRSSARLTLAATWLNDHDPSVARDRLEIVQGLLGIRTRELARCAPGLELSTLLAEGPPAPTFIEASRGADLLVVGAPRLSGLGISSLWSVSHHCVVHAHCPVVVVRDHDHWRPAGPPQPPRIVVGVDGSPGSDQALAWAVHEAVRGGATLIVLAAWSFPQTSPSIVAANLGVPEAAHDVAAQAVATAARMAPRLVARGEVRADPAPVALVEASRRADLVVVGSRGMGAFKGMLLGTVGLHVAQHARCSVVVVRELVEGNPDES